MSCQLFVAFHIACVLRLCTQHGAKSKLADLSCLCRAGGGNAGISAKDALGNDVKATEWLKKHPAGDRSLVQGLKVIVELKTMIVMSLSFLLLTPICLLLQADATYLVVTDDSQIEKYGLNAVCTHLGCVVPWNNVRAACLLSCSVYSMCSGIRSVSVLVLSLF